MNRLRRAWQLPAPERRLLLAAYGLLWLAVVCLRTFRLRRTRRMVAGVARLLARARGARRAAPHSAELVGWAVEAAGRHVPGATCLAQALVAQVLLAMRGAKSTLEVGVAREASGGLDAHAWVQCMGTTVVGGGDVARYAPLLSMDLR